MPDKNRISYHQCSIHACLITRAYAAVELYLAALLFFPHDEFLPGSVIWEARSQASAHGYHAALFHFFGKNSHAHTSFTPRHFPSSFLFARPLNAPGPSAIIRQLLQSLCFRDLFLHYQCEATGRARPPSIRPSLQNFRLVSFYLSLLPFLLPN